MRDDSDADHQFVEAFSGLTNFVQQTMMAEGLDTFEYAMVAATDLDAYAAERWRVVPIPPFQEVKVTLGQATPGPLTFLMERKVIVSDTPGGM